MTRDIAIIAGVVLLAVGSIPLLVHSDESGSATVRRVIGGVGFTAALVLLVWWIAKF